MLKHKLIAAACLAATSVAAPAFAGGLVNVSIADVSILNNFLNGSQIAALNNLSVPITVQAPLGVAANVCGVSAAVLGKSVGGASCTASSGSQALAHLVSRQVLQQP